MKKQQLLFITFSLILSVASAQEQWQLLNPRPSSATGLDIEFVSDTKGFYITGNELFKTDDAGGNWLLIRNINGAKDLSFKDDLGIVVGASGTVYKSEDSGDSWSVINVGAPEKLNTVSIIDINTIVVSGNNSIFITTDKGLNWQQHNIPSSRVNKTFFLSADVGHAVTDNGEIFKTINGGENWSTTASFTNLTPNSFFTVFFKNENVGFATREHDDFFKTTDGGETWNVINDGISHAIFSFQFIDDMVGFGAGEYGMYKTTNGGDTWSRIALENSYVYATDMYGIYFLNENQGFSVGQRGRIAKTIDSGENWELYSPIQGVGQIKFSPNNRTIINTGLDLYELSDNSIDWELLGTPSEVSGIKYFQFFDEDNGICFAGSTYRTADGGKTWQKAEDFGLYFDFGASSFEFVNENLGFASGGFNQKRTYKTTDGGEIWRVVLQQNLRQIQFLNESVGYATTIGFSTDIMYKTIDGGENWTAIFSSEDDIGALYFTTPENGYVVGDDGLAFKTVDGGATWQELDLPYHDFEHLKFHSDLVGYAIEEYGRFFKTVNGGLSWEQIYQNSGINDLEITPEGEIFVTGDFGRILKSQVTYEDADIFVKEATNITVSSANIETIIAANGNAANNIVLQYGENSQYEHSISLNPNSVEEGSLLNIETVISGLEANTTYNFRVVAVSGDVEYVSNLGTLTTLPNYTINMNYVYVQGGDNELVSGNISANNRNISAVNFEYGTSPNTYSESVEATPNSVAGGMANVNVEAVLGNLDAETTYHVRIKAEYEGEIIYSNPVSFTTNPNFRITTYNPTITGNQARIGAYIFAYKDDLEEIVIEYGEQGFDNEVPALPNTIMVDKNGVISSIISGLEPEKIYYYRIKAKQGEDTIYGPEGILSLSENVVLLIDEDQDIFRESARVNGRVFTQNGFLSNIQIEYGITADYGFSSYASPSFSKAVTTTGIESLIGNLSPNTTYYYRIKATKDNIDYYSENATFTTLEALPIDNFKITVSSETCVDKDNGILKIEASVTSNYIATLGFEQYGFSNSLLIENLQPGTYNLCIRENDSVNSQCFQFEVNESEQISGKTQVENGIFGKQLKVNMEMGTFPFLVKINNEKIGEYQSSSFSLNISEGDTIEIVSKYNCEGKLALEIPYNNFGDSFINPVNTIVEILVKENDTTVLLELFDLKGSLLESVKEHVTNNSVLLNMEKYPNGLYLIKIHGDTIRTHKLLKK